MLNINPLISYADLELPFPMTRSLWEAKCAQDWRDTYLSSLGPGPGSTERLPSLVDTLRDMSAWHLHGRIDHHLSALVILHGLSALIGEYHRLKFIARGASKHWNALVINSRQQELAQVLTHFRMLSHPLSSTSSSNLSSTSTSDLSSSSSSKCQISLLHEVISMFLFMSLEDLQLFAGKEDKLEARRVYDSALEWINSTDSRRAIWHAGQVLRAARCLQRSGAGAGVLTGFLAVGVYYASLAFWSYGVVSRANDNINKPGVGIGLDMELGLGLGLEGNEGEEVVFLDGEEDGTVQRFVSLGRGRPALRPFQGGITGEVVVSDPGRVMDVARSLLVGDAPVESLPPLVQGLVQLMGDLGRAA